MQIISVRQHSKVKYLQSVVGKAPKFTPNKNDAMPFANLNKCKNIRDHALEYCDSATILIL